MAKAFQPIGVEVLPSEAGEQQVPCVTQRPDRASDFLQDGLSGLAPCSAGKAPVRSSAENCGFGLVHVLFHIAIASALIVGVSCFAVPSSIGVGAHFEFTARIDREAAPKWLGNMAKAFQPIGVEVLLRSAGHGDMGGRR